MGFVSGMAAMGLMGAGMYMLMSDKTKKQAAKTMESAMEDASKMMNKKADAMNKMVNN